MKLFNKFTKDIQGGLAMVFAIGSMSLVVTVGAAIDINRAYRAELYLQDLTDSAALAAARDHTLKPKQKRKIAKEFIETTFDANFDLNVLRVKLRETKNGTVRVKTNAEINTIIMGIVGKNTLKIKAVSEVRKTVSGGPVEIAFILDTTNSMATFGSSWSDVVNALEDLMIKLEKDAGDPSAFKASLVPFGDRVNLGAKAYNWIDNSYLASPAASSNYKGCVEPRGETIGSSANRLTKKTPKKLPFIPSTVGTYGYVKGCPTVSIVYPTTNITKLKRAINEIRPAGTGRFDVGLAWGHRMLSNNWRNSIARGAWPKKKNVTKIAVFLTDGYSTAYEGEVLPVAARKPWGWNLGTPEGFENLAFVCDAMKADGIQMHIIGVNVQPHALATMKACATDADHYYTVTNASDIIKAVKEIGVKATDLRISH
ncbi:MAG: hypothetical protein COA43_06685 [Robiginitomaculum sp.]|nr:MAG: hypothetical protein COA43_06685 [Robiginitomaculum sp.]